MNLLEFEKPLIEIRLKIKDIEALNPVPPDRAAELARLRAEEKETEARIYANPSVWRRTQIARHPKRPGILEFIQYQVKDFIELKGDRSFRDDPTVVGGLGKIDGEKIMIIGTAKGSNTKENVERNFGMPHPEGYRKGVRLMELADRFQVPLVTLVDTPGAFPGIGAEERNQSEAIAQSIMKMSSLRVPVISVITGEGGSGGAIALAMGNILLMFSNSFYSIISPEGCAGILWGDGSRAPEAAEYLKYTAQDLKNFGIIDEIIDEGSGPAHLNPEWILNLLKQKIIRHLNGLKRQSPDELAESRYQKYRKIGSFINGNNN